MATSGSRNSSEEKFFFLLFLVVPDLENLGSLCLPKLFLRFSKIYWVSFEKKKKIHSECRVYTASFSFT